MIGDLILKEEISNYKCINATENKSDYWYNELAYAVRLGNEFKGKTSISFNTTEGIKTVETTVWSLTENYLQIKGGISIPLSSIVNIHF